MTGHKNQMIGYAIAAEEARMAAGQAEFDAQLDSIVAAHAQSIANDAQQSAREGWAAARQLLDIAKKFNEERKELRKLLNEARELNESINMTATTILVMRESSAFGFREVIAQSLNALYEANPQHPLLSAKCRSQLFSNAEASAYSKIISDGELPLPQNRDQKDIPILGI